MVVGRGELEVRETCVVEEGSDRGVWHLEVEMEGRKMQFPSPSPAFPSSQNADISAIGKESD